MEKNGEQEFLTKIRKNYATNEPKKLDELKAMDKKVRKPAVVFAYVFGVIASLVMGVGMCLAMKVVGNMFALGIAIGCVGIALCVLNYYVYRVILNSRKKKYADRIISLSNELLNNEI